ncbi:MAG: M42 family metallopeptidase [Chloroflexi bacterium]|nr:M42 family metallopeptidase [Chloroflexota bacterium]
MKTLIAKLVDAIGPSGFENTIREVIREETAAWADEIWTDTMGNLYVRKAGTDGGQRIMVAAHMDEIGVIVTQVEDSGLVRFANIGALLPKTLLGARVRFSNGAVGVISHDGGAKAEIQNSKLPDLHHWYIDVGASSEDNLPVHVGDVGVFAHSFVDLGQRAIVGGADNRIGCAVAIETLRRLQHQRNEVIMVFTVQEEIGTRGARVAAYQLRPDLALAIDITPTGDAPKSELTIAVDLGKGPAIPVADTRMISHPRLRQALVDVAVKEGIPHQVYVLTLGSTDAAAIEPARTGVITANLMVPCRYVHTPSELVDWQDVEHTVRLLTAFLQADLSTITA